VSPPTASDLRNIAIAAADAGAEVAIEWMRRGTALDTEVKGHGDYVTAADRAVEAVVVGMLREHAPGIPIVAEESGGARSGGRCWYVDPIDGTTNFLRGFPIVGVSVGLLEDGMPLVGAVAAPFIPNASWSAARGEGAHDHNRQRLKVSQHGGRGVVATGFPFRRPGNMPRYLPVFDAALGRFEDIRRAGAASLDLAYTAVGAFDGYFELGLSTWDVAAGSLLVLEAGGVVTDWDGDARAIYSSGDVLAGSPAWHERMLEMVRASDATR